MATKTHRRTRRLRTVARAARRIAVAVLTQLLIAVGQALVARYLPR